MDWSLESLPWKKCKAAKERRIEDRVAVIIDGEFVNLYRGHNDIADPWEYEIYFSILPLKNIHYHDKDPLAVQAILFDAAERGAIELAHNQNSMR